MSYPPADFLFWNAAFEPDALLVSRFTGKEALSQLFRFDIDLGALQTDVPFGNLVNKPATLMLSRGDGEGIRVHGLVADFEQRGFQEGMAMYRAVLVPRAWILTLSFQSRIFQKMTIPEVIEKVLKDGGLPSTAYRLDLQGSYDQREYVAQYQETDWNFICRWMEHLGILFYFEHGEHDEVLVITDHSDACPEAGVTEAILYQPDAGALADSENRPTIQDISLRERVGTGEVILKDYNYRDPNTDLKVDAPANAEMPGTHYEYGGHYLKTAAGNALARVRGEELASGRRVLSGRSNIVPFRAGHTFALDLDAAYRSDLNVSWLLTHVDHFGTQGSGLATARGLEGATYSNTFRCIPASTPYRPPRLTPVPQPALVTAVTETAGGDYAHLDEDGRYHAKLHFDLGPEGQGKASLPIRVTQPYSGKNYGMHFPLHAGAEIILAFINGNIDQPIALGTAPNPNTTSPSTSKNKTENVIRTQGGNELVFDDTKDKQKIHLKTKKGHILLFDDEKDTLMLQSSDKNQTVTIDMKNKKITLENKTGDIEMKAPTGTVSVEAMDVKVKATKNVEVKANANIDVEATANLKLKATANIDVEATAQLNQKGAMVTTEGQAMHTVKSSGILTLQGSLVKIN